MLEIQSENISRINASNYGYLYHDAHVLNSSRIFKCSQLPKHIATCVTRCAKNAEIEKASLTDSNIEPKLICCFGRRRHV